MTIAVTDGSGGQRSRYQHIRGWAYPEGVRLAVNFTLDYDAQLYRRVLNEPPMELTQGEFGGRTGIWRLLDLFERHRIGLTMFVPGRITQLYPASLREAAKRGFEIANHMWEHRVPPEPELDRDHVTRTTTALEALAGRRPVGSRSRHRLESLARAGYLYTSNGAADEIPYYVTDGGTTLLNLPFHYALDDAMYFHFGWLSSENPGQRITDCDSVHDIFLSHFERLYEAGAYMNICVHDFVSGRALRVAMLERLITEMKRRPGVWFPTCEQVARYCLERFPPAMGAAERAGAAAKKG
jgi:peptidoglycan-N-acetylglucosamine deacetylase